MPRFAGLFLGRCSFGLHASWADSLMPAVQMWDRPAGCCPLMPGFPKASLAKPPRGSKRSRINLPTWYAEPGRLDPSRLARPRGVRLFVGVGMAVPNAWHHRSAIARCAPGPVSRGAPVGSFIGRCWYAPSALPITIKKPPDKPGGGTSLVETGGRRDYPNLPDVEAMRKAP
jgi:hypothetical protein